MVILQLKSKVIREPIMPVLSLAMVTGELFALASDLAHPFC